MNNERKELFKTGAPLPDMFAQYFIGQAYLEPVDDAVYGKLK